MKQLDINNVTISYEVTGQGAPMLFVHGNGEDHTIFDKTVNLLRDHFTCYLVDSRGHGKSSRVSEFHYRDMAMDMVLFLDELHLENVTFVGFSDGGIIGLMAAGMTQRISTLITCGANMRPEGLKAFFSLPMRILNVFKKDPLLELMIEEPDLTDEELRKIKADTLIVAGQHDLIRRKETDHIARTVPRAKELIVPGQTHTSYVVHSEKLGKIILQYFHDDLKTGMSVKTMHGTYRNCEAKNGFIL